MKISECILCKKDYTNSESELYYCLCDSAVCKTCLNSKGLKINDNSWKCPNCNNIMSIEESQLFRIH